MDEKRKATVWVDVSLLLICNPYQATGIFRTSANLFRSWWSRGFGNLRLCRLAPEANGYVEVPAARILARFPMRPETDEADQPAPTRRPFKIAAWAKRILLPVLVKRLARVALDRTRPVRRAAARLRCRLVGPVPLSMDSNDIIITLGGGWTTPGAGVLAERLRREQKFRSVHLIYDLIPLAHPQFVPAAALAACNFKQFFDSSLRQSDLIITIARCVQREIREYLVESKIGLRPVEVIRLGEGIPVNAASGYPPLADSFDSTAPFVLCVGTLDSRKNHYLLYHVWRRLVENHGAATPRLILVGTKGGLFDDLQHQIRVDPLTRDSIIIIPHCDDVQLRWLYRNCLITLFPSHCEGWGLPVAESLAYGKHCICSNASSIMEIAPTLVDAHDPVDLPNCLRLIELALDPAYRTAKEQRIRDEFRQTSWNDTADQFIQHIEKTFGPVFERGAGTALAKSA